MAATRLDTEQRFSQVSELYLLGTKYALLVLFAVVALILSYGHSIMTIWLKEGFVGKGDVILSVLAVGALFRLWHTPGFYVVVGLGKHRLFGIMTFVNAFFSVSLAIILLIWSGLGVVGVAIGFTVPIVITGVLVIMPYCCRVARVSVWQEVRLSVIPAIVATLPLLGVLSVLRAYFIPHSAMGLLALVSILSVPTLAGWWWLGLSRMERRRFLDMLPAGIGRFRRSRVDGR